MSGAHAPRTIRSPASRRAMRPTAACRRLAMHVAADQAAARRRRLVNGDVRPALRRTGAGTPGRYGSAGRRTPPRRRRWCGRTAPRRGSARPRPGRAASRSVPSRAAKAAGISRAPVAKQARPRPRLSAPKANRNAMSCADTAKRRRLRGGEGRGDHGAEAGRRRHAHMGEAARDDGGDRERHRDQQRQPVADRRNVAGEAIPRP